MNDDANDCKAEFDYSKYNVVRVTGVFDVGEIDWALIDLDDLSFGID